jgi:hypothetical protein
LINVHAREVDDLEDAFALIVQGRTFVFAVRRGLLEPDELDLLERLLRQATAARRELLQVTA